MSDELIDRLTGAVYPALALLAGVELALFSTLGQQELRADQLTSRMKVAQHRLEPLLYALVKADVLEIVDGRFRNSPTALRCLVPGGSGYRADEAEFWAQMWRAGLETATSIRCGVPQVCHDYSTMAPDQLDRFFTGLHADCIAAGRILAQQVDWSEYSTAVDIGGGSGGLAIGLVEQVSHVRPTVVEQANVVPVTRRFIAAAGLARQVEVLAADLVQAPLERHFDVAVLKAFLQTMGPEAAARALGHVARSLRPGGQVVIMGNGIVEDSRLAPADRVFFNVMFVNLYAEGRAYTVGDYRSWLAAAGFEHIQWDGILLRAWRRLK